MLDALAAKFGFIRKSDVIRNLQFARSVGKRLDEHREVVEAIKANTALFDKSAGHWHAGHMAIQDDYLMRLYYMVHASWPDDSVRYQRNGEVVRPRPVVLGECSLPEYPKQQQIMHPAMEPFPIVDGYKFQVMRGNALAKEVASSKDVSDFLDACSIKAGSQDWHAAFAGVPIQVDGTTMRFIRT